MVSKYISGIQVKQKDNTVNFENQVFYIGIDVHKNSWSVTHTNNKNKKKRRTLWNLET